MSNADTVNVESNEPSPYEMNYGLNDKDPFVAIASKPASAPTLTEHSRGQRNVFLRG
jgi:hypothetical protein